MRSLTPSTRNGGLLLRERDGREGGEGTEREGKGIPRKAKLSRINSADERCGLRQLTSASTSNQWSSSSAVVVAHA